MRCRTITKRSENLAKGSVRAAVSVSVGADGIADATGKGGEEPFRCLAMVLPSLRFTLSCRRAPKNCETAYRKMAHSYAKQEFMSNRISLAKRVSRPKRRLVDQASHLLLLSRIISAKRYASFLALRPPTVGSTARVVQRVKMTTALGWSDTFVFHKTLTQEVHRCGRRLTYLTI